MLAQTSYTLTLQASATGTVTTGNLNCGAACTSLGVCSSGSGSKLSATLIRFDINLSPNATVSSASLSLPIALAGSGSASMGVYAVSANWTMPTGNGADNNPCGGNTPGTGEPTYENQITPSTAWATAPGSTGALLLSLTPTSNTPSDSFATNRQSGSFTALVRQWVANNATNFGIVVVPRNTSDFNVFFGKPTLTIVSDQFVPTSPPIKSVTYNPTATRNPLGTGVYVPTRYVRTTTNGAVIGGVIGGVAAVIIIVSVATICLRTDTRVGTRRRYRY